MANIEQAQQMIPLITREISFGQDVSELDFGVDVFDLDFWVQIYSIQHAIQCNFWVLETCLIVRLLPFVTILITASLSSNTYSKVSWREDWTFERTESMFFITSILFWDL